VILQELLDTKKFTDVKVKADNSDEYDVEATIGARKIVFGALMRKKLIKMTSLLIYGK